LASNDDEESTEEKTPPSNQMVIRQILRAMVKLPFARESANGCDQREPYSPEVILAICRLGINFPFGILMPRPGK
jgi:hypothetical protein